MEDRTGLRQRLAALLIEQEPAIVQGWQGRVAEGAEGPAITAEEWQQGAPEILRILAERLRDEDTSTHRDRLVALLQQFHDARPAVGSAAAGLSALVTASVLSLKGHLGAGDKMEEIEAELESEVTALRAEVWAAEAELSQGDVDDLQGQFDSLLEVVPDPVLVVGVARGRIRAANPAALALTGYSPAQLRTLLLQDLIPALDGTGPGKFLDEVVETGTSIRDGLELVSRSGDRISGDLRGALVRRDGLPAAVCIYRVGTSDAPGTGTAVPEEAFASKYEQLDVFFENVISALPLRLVVLDSDLRVIHANPAFYVQRGMAKEEVLGQDIDAVLPPELLDDAGLRAALQSVLLTGERVRWTGYRDYTPRQGERILNVRLDPCEGPARQRMVLLTFEDITERHYQLYERSVLQQIARALLGELNLPKLLYAILTGMTAGGAVGLGFNRAILMLVDEEAGVLRAEMAVGPASLEQAAAIWTEVSDDYRTLDDFLANYEKLPPAEERPLHELVHRMVFPLKATQNLPMAAITQRQTIHVVDAEMDERVPSALREMLETDEFVVAPLVARDKIIGVAIADNRFSQQPIGHSAVQLLTALADQAALAIDSARMFSQATEDARRLDQALTDLRSAQEESLRTAKLAAIGEVTAIVAHEIRSPLSAIGGFARSIVREPHRVDRNARAAKIIVEEVVRLERILAELLDFTKPSESVLEPVDLAPLVAGVVQKMRAAPESAEVEYHVRIEEGLPLVEADPKHVTQIVQNLVMNALQAMPQGGSLTVTAHAKPSEVEVSIEDTGEGIAEDRLEKVFDTFYTTKPTGTGLGLALCQKLAAQQGAEIKVKSTVGKGTTFIVSFPVRPKTRALEQGVQ
ncbi:PAS domain-containing protein [bacterium]|nr:PAS domain-containing protein [bacterium]